MSNGDSNKDRDKDRTIKRIEEGEKPRPQPPETRKLPSDRPPKKQDDD